MKNDSYKYASKHGGGQPGPLQERLQTLEMLCHVPLPPLDKRFSKYTMLIRFQPKI